MNKTILRSKFRGTLVGTLIGDCCGAPFDGEIFSTGGKIVLQKYFDTLEGKYFKAPVKKHTADSCLTKCIAQCLLMEKRLDSTQLAKSFTKEFLQDPHRGYKENLIVIFNKLRANKFSEPLKPAQDPANFTSSSDNSGAVRVAPIALVNVSQYNEMVKEARKSIELTHTNREGVLGGLVQCVALHQNLNWDPDRKLNVNEYLEELMEKVAKLENEEDGLSMSGDTAAFQTQLKILHSLLVSSRHPSDEEVLDKLGHSSRALYSVPTSIYCFLRPLHNVPVGVYTKNPLRGALQYAISLGGDTSALAAMTGALAGAYHGDIINENLRKHCEGTELFEKLANQLFDEIS